MNDLRRDYADTIRCTVRPFGLLAMLIAVLVAIIAVCAHPALAAADDDAAVVLEGTPTIGVYACDVPPLLARNASVQEERGPPRQVLRVASRSGDSDAVAGALSAVQFRGFRVAANGAKTFTSADAHVADVANSIEKAMPGRVKDVNNQIPMSNGLKREIDIDLGDLVVQVKSGNARGLQGQLEKTTATTGRTAIGYAPNMPNGAWEAAARNGIPIARNNDELLAIIGELQ